MFVPLQPFATPITAVPGALLVPADGASAVSSDDVVVATTVGLAPADAGHALASSAPAVTWTGVLAPADGGHALTSDVAEVTGPELSPPAGGGRVIEVRGEARTTGVPLS